MHDVIIIGAGPAGLSAALWCDELGLDTLVVEREREVGGQLLRVYNPIENYLGATAKDGRELRDRMAAQVEDREFDLWTEARIESVDLRAKRVRLLSGEELQSVAVIIATGVRRRSLGIPGEEELAGRGVVSPASRDREGLAGRDVCVVGCDDAAGESALLLAEICPTVTLVHRKQKLSMRSGLIERIRGQHRITIFTEAELIRILGEDHVKGVEIKRRGAFKSFHMAVGGVVISAGVEPNTELFRDQVETDEDGYICVTGARETGVMNVFAVGDVAHALTQNISAAVGDGATAAKVIAARLGTL
jgi:thioredoxin reductase (NADPH)